MKVIYLTLIYQFNRRKKANYNTLVRIIFLIILKRSLVNGQYQTWLVIDF